MAAEPATLPDCPACEGEGTRTVAFRAVRATDTSPCDSEREVTCEECKGTGDADTLDCNRCGEEIDVGGGEFVSADRECARCSSAVDAAEYRCEGDR